MQQDTALSPGNRVTIRLALSEDTALLSALSEATFRAQFAEENTPEDMDAYVRDNFSQDQLSQEIADPLATFFIAQLSGKAVGYAKLKYGEPDVCVTGAKPVELVRLYLLPDSIGHGIGAALMKQCVQSAQSQGFDTIWLGVWEHNPRALAFYEKWDFVPVGSHVFQLGSEAQTDLILQKSLIDGR